MGKILFVADIHGNMPAVEALEKEIERLQPDDILVFGGCSGKRSGGAQSGGLGTQSL